jgi:hypothetical protein
VNVCIGANLPIPVLANRQVASRPRSARGRPSGRPDREDPMKPTSHLERRLPELSDL